MKNKSILVIIILMTCSCAKLGYLLEQGNGQMSLQWNGVKNEKLLEDKKISNEEKNKISLIVEYKRYFYHFLKRKETDIYSKTTFLDSKAVTYLLISAKHNELKAQKTKFPFVGSFPYLGFFKLDSARDWAKDLEREGFVTWIRPVYAYSTLGYFEDRILSSFFHFDEYELAELVFHELFHTVFFLKDDIDFNESLATYFSDKMMREYFKNNTGFEMHLAEIENAKKLEKVILDLAHILKVEFKKMEGYITEERSAMLMQRFNNEIFLPKLKNSCLELKLDNGICEDNMKPWNQAQFAAFLTYEEDLPLFEKLQTKLNIDLYDFFLWLEREMEVYKKEIKKIKIDEEKEGFAEYLQRNYL